MTVTPERWQKMKGLFQDALERPRAERSAFLGEACMDDPELQREVEALLRDHDQAGTFIERPALAGSEPPQATASWVGSTLGPYRVLREIAQGGMGAVYLAQRADEQYHQRVAIKLIRWGLASEHNVARFRRERQILASLSHPSIARLLDGGTTHEGQPYLVMEHIEGEPIDRFCDQRRLSISERLRLFRKVCAAVHYAHQNLVIHRDIKPSNILVTAQGEPKLLDFGTAKLLEPAFIDGGAAPTETGLRLMTPEYASPEQLRSQTITTASDVYSLGVVLYELMTGHRPYRFADRHSPEVLRIVCEEEPQRPSTIVTHTEQLVTAEGTSILTPDQVGRDRQQLPEKLKRRLEGDLDNILLMALRKEPQRRYASAEQLSEDIDRHLEGLTIRARKDTVTYRLGKFVGRHRIAVAAGTLATLALLMGVVVATSQARLAMASLVEVERQKAKAEGAFAFIIDLFELSNPMKGRGQEVTAREFLDLGATRAAVELADQPELQASLMDTIGTAYSKLGHYERAEPLLVQAYSKRLEMFGEEHEDVAHSLAHLGDLARDQNQYAEAEDLYTRSLALFRKLLGPEHLQVAELLDDLGRVCFQRGDFECAQRLYTHALETRRRLVSPVGEEVAESLNNLAALPYARGNFESAEKAFREVLELQREHLGNRKSPGLANVLGNLATVLQRRASELHDLGKPTEVAGKLREAEPFAREALAIDSNLFGEDSPRVAEDMDRLAVIFTGLRKLEEAEALANQALEIFRARLGKDHPRVGLALHNLAWTKAHAGELDDAEALFRQALDVFEKSLEAGDPRIAGTRASLEDLLAKRSRS